MGLRNALRAEWTKLRTVPGPAGLLVGIVAVTVAVSAGLASSLECTPAGCDRDLTLLSLAGVRVGQALVAGLAVTVVSGEYGTGMIRTTMMAMPRRHTILTAKALVVTGVVLVAGALAIAGCVVAGRLLLPAGTFAGTDGPTLRAAAGSVLYLALVALMSVGVAAAVRDAAAAAGTVFGLLYAFPLLAGLVADPGWNLRLQQIAPTTAGLAIQATTDLDRVPLSPWAGLAVLAGWAAAALLAGGLLFRWRDA
jgi:ABC-2 type transport system permease protein